MKNHLNPLVKYILNMSTFQHLNKHNLFAKNVLFYSYIYEIDEIMLLSKSNDY